MQTLPIDNSRGRFIWMRIPFRVSFVQYPESMIRGFEAVASRYPRPPVRGHRSRDEPTEASPQESCQSANAERTPPITRLRSCGSSPGRQAAALAVPTLPPTPKRQSSAAESAGCSVVAGATDPQSRTRCLLLFLAKERGSARITLETCIQRPLGLGNRLLVSGVERIDPVLNAGWTSRDNRLRLRARASPCSRARTKVSRQGAVSSRLLTGHLSRARWRGLR